MNTIARISVRRLAALAAVAALAIPSLGVAQDKAAVKKPAAKAEAATAAAPKPLDAQSEALIGSWEKVITKKDDPALSRSFTVVFDIWKDEKGELAGYSAVLGFINPLSEIKREGDKVSWKIDHPSGQKGVVTGTINGKTATLTVDESYSGPKPYTIDFTWSPFEKGPDLADAEWAGLYAGKFADDRVPPENRRPFSASIQLIATEKEAGAAITLGGAKHTASLVRRSKNRVYFEWDDPALDKPMKGRFLGTVAEGKIVGQFEGKEGRGDVSLIKVEDDEEPAAEPAKEPVKKPVKKP